MSFGILNLRVLIVCTFLFQAGGAKAQSSQDISPTARAYVQAALDIMQNKSLRKKQVDWDTLRRETFARAAGAEQTVDTYEAIRFALRAIGDNHSFLQLSRELAEKESARHKASTSVETGKAERPDSPYVVRRKPEGFLHNAGGCVVPRIVVPLFPSRSQKGDAFATELQKFIADADAQQPCGWIVDLRGNGGGSVFPMLAGVGPLLEEGDVAFAVNAEGQKTSFFYKDGRAGVRNSDGSEIVPAKVEGVAHRVAGKLPVAVLIDRSTGSSGEIIVVAFRSRANTRIFGEPTYGASTSTEGFKLSDGANIVLATAVGVDRNGREYPAGISPDEVIPVGDKILPANADPVIHAALGWLGEQTR